MSVTPEQLTLLSDFREYVDTVGGTIDTHDSESILDDSQALDLTLCAFVDSIPTATVADYDAMIEHLGSHGWNGVPRMTPRKTPPAKAILVDGTTPGAWHNTTLKSVDNICADDIGRTMRFYTWDATRQIASIVTGELRQLSANGEEVTVHFGLMAEREWTFQRGETVAFEPRFDMGDVKDLRQAFCDFHGITEDLP